MNNPAEDFRYNSRQLLYFISTSGSSIKLACPGA
jgi:hypothetical protein